MYKLCRTLAANISGTVFFSSEEGRNPPSSFLSLELNSVTNPITKQVWHSATPLGSPKRNGAQWRMTDLSFGRKLDPSPILLGLSRKNRKLATVRLVWR